jgi:predicted nucleic acid-binding protein
LIEDADLFIAVIALVHDMILVTNNVTHFARIPGLQVEDWLLS